ncbi:MAG TPA: hypothetical protein VM691_01000 [Myxococcales bacterium]|jgi:hypothetical protein|nr:hypothetical protein [Myxococcales bacterium]HZX93234.1 hypothetical protein [Myxococcales bacterium]
MPAVALAILFLSLVAVDVLRDRAIDPRPVLTHPRSLLLLPALAAAAAAWRDEPVLFLLSAASLGALAALVTERFLLTDRGIECRGAVLEWGTLRVLRRTPLFLELRTTRGQRLLLPRWMDGLGTLTRAAERSTLDGWSRPGEFWN